MPHTAHQLSSAPREEVYGVGIWCTVCCAVVTHEDDEQREQREDIRDDEDDLRAREALFVRGALEKRLEHLVPSVHKLLL